METQNNVLDMDLLIYLRPDNIPYFSTYSRSQTSVNKSVSKDTPNVNDTFLNENTSKSSNDIPASKCCHLCKKAGGQGSRIYTCGTPTCRESFCRDCIDVIRKRNGKGPGGLGHRNSPKWRCPICRGMCNCSKCKLATKRKKKGKVKKKKNVPHKKGSNIIMIPFKSVGEEDVINKNISINGYDVIEINELNEDMVIEKKMTKNKKIYAYRSSENYFVEKYGETELNMKCIHCANDWFNANDLLHFADRKELVNYIKYCFQFLKRKIFLNNANFVDNKYELEKLDTSYFKNWKFFQEKIICKSCFMQIVNMHNLFGNLKSFFQDPIIEPLSPKPFHQKKFSCFLRKKRRKKIIVDLSETEKPKDSNNTIINKEDKHYNQNVIYDASENLLIILKKVLNLNPVPIKEEKVINEPIEKAYQSIESGESNGEEENIKESSVKEMDENGSEEGEEEEEAESSESSEDKPANAKTTIINNNFNIINNHNTPLTSSHITEPVFINNGTAIKMLVLYQDLIQYLNNKKDSISFDKNTESFITFINKFDEITQFLSKIQNNIALMVDYIKNLYLRTSEAKEKEELQCLYGLLLLIQKENNSLFFSHQGLYLYLHQLQYRNQANMYHVNSH